MDTRIPLITQFSFPSDQYRELTDPFEGHGISCPVREHYQAGQLVSEIITLGTPRLGRGVLQVMIMHPKDRPAIAWVAPARDQVTKEWDPPFDGGEELRIRAIIMGHRIDPEWGKSSEEQWHDSAVARLQAGETLDLTEISSVLRWMTRRSE